MHDLDRLAERLNTMHFDANELLYHSHRLSAMVVIAKAVLLSALGREESRGAHLRIDFPDADDALRLCSITQCSDGDIAISYVDEANAGGEAR